MQRSSARLRIRVNVLPVALTLAMATAGSVTARGAAAQAGIHSGSASTPTFYADVLPVLQKHCQVCHQAAAPLEEVGGFYTGGLVAPMALEQYQEVRAWAPVIAVAVREGRMPPWGAHVRHKGTFKGER
jgi:mono/diheme cytochrome c family protein